MMNIESTQFEKAIVLKVSGRMDAENAGEFDKACELWISQGARHLIADLADLQYECRVRLSAFVCAANAVRLHPRSRSLCEVQGLVRRVSDMTKLDSLCA